MGLPVSDDVRVDPATQWGTGLDIGDYECLGYRATVEDGRVRNIDIKVVLRSCQAGGGVDGSRGRDGAGRIGVLHEKSGVHGVLAGAGEWVNAGLEILDGVWIGIAGTFVTWIVRIASGTRLGHGQRPKNEQTGKYCGQHLDGEPPEEIRCGPRA